MLFFVILLERIKVGKMMQISEVEMFLGNL